MDYKSFQPRYTDSISMPKFKYTAYTVCCILQDRRTPFSSIGRSMLKMLVMTTGEFEFDKIFIYDQELVDEGLSLFLPELTAVLWVIFIIIMPILFSNLLVM